MTISEAKKLKILECISGSHAYGIATPESDVDTRGIFRVHPEDFMSLVRPPKQVTDNEDDTTFWELRRYFELAAECNPNIIELLFTPEDCINFISPAGRKLLDNRNLFISKRAYHTFSGYAHSQIKRAKGQNKWINNPKPEETPDKLDFCWLMSSHSTNWAPCRPTPLDIDLGKFNCSSVEHLPNAYRLYEYGDEAKGVFRGPNQQLVVESIPKEDECSRFAGILIFNEQDYNRAHKDWEQYWEWRKNRNEARYRSQEAGEIDYDAKNMMHCFRLLWSGINIMKCGKPIVRCEDNFRDYLNDIRAGEFSHDFLMKRVEEDMEELRGLRDKSDLPEKVNRKAINKLYQELAQGE